jgi:hypothetical protein
MQGGFERCEPGPVDQAPAGSGTQGPDDQLACTLHTPVRFIRKRHPFYPPVASYGRTDGLPKPWNAVVIDMVGLTLDFTRWKVRKPLDHGGEGSFKGFRSKSFPTHLSTRIGNFLQCQGLPCCCIEQTRRKHFRRLGMRVLLKWHGSRRTSPRVRSSKGNGRSCLTLKRFRSKAFSSVPAGSVMGIFCNIEVYIQAFD